MWVRAALARLVLVPCAQQPALTSHWLLWLAPDVGIAPTALHMGLTMTSLRSEFSVAAQNIWVESVRAVDAAGRRAARGASCSDGRWPASSSS